MRELARRVGITPSHLSKIERGLANPSVGTLWTVSDELGVPVAAMFAGEEYSQTRVSPSAHRRHTAPQRSQAGDPLLSVFAPAVDPGHRELIKMAGVEFQRLTPHDDLSLEFMEVRHEIGAGDPEAYHHRGREYGLVLTGRLQVEIGFAKYVLDPGWSIAFDSSNPHRVLNIGDEPASAVWVVVGRN
jgi:transcriptional regulator with XRE-family HTH domain